MTQVDFYLLPVSEPQARLMYACRLAEKAWKQGREIYIQTADAADAKQLDELMWTFRDASFVPHGLIGSEPRAPIEIGCGEDAGDHHDVLVNLSGEIPPFFGRFERVAEIVLNDAEQKQQMRDAWRFYKDRGYPLNHHEIASLGGGR